MKNVMKKIFGQKGFSLPEVMLAVGLMGGMSLLVTHVVKQTDQVKKSTETSTNTFAALYQIQSLFSKKDVCLINLQNKVVPSDLTNIIIRDSGGTDKVIFEVGKTYDGGSIKLTKLSLSKNGAETLINVSIEKVGNKKQNGLNPVVVSKSIPVNAEYYKNNPTTIMSCESDLMNHVTEAEDKAVEKICDNPNGNMFYDAVTKRCTTKEQMGTNPLFKCPDGQSLTAIRHDSGLKQYSMQCEDSLKLTAGTCATNQVLRRDGQTLTCVDVNCSANQFFQGLDASGNVICKSCPGSGSVVFVNGVLQCKQITCAGDEYMVGIDSNGSPICNGLVVDKGACANGKLAVDANGKLFYSCCTINCSDSGTQCNGASYTSSNNCGQCVGTQPISCPTSSNYCTGTSYAGTCGLCQGTRLPTNAQWNDWTPCTNGKRTRTCNNNQACGGAGCIGDSIEDCGSPTWTCQKMARQLQSGQTNYYENINLRPSVMDWLQIRPAWPTIKTPGNNWQQGNHQWCVNECVAYAENLYKASIDKTGGKAVMVDSTKAIVVGISDVFFQEWVNYNLGTPGDSNDQSGWWCGCMPNLHNKTAPPTYGPYTSQKSTKDAQVEQGTFCTLNGTIPPGGTPTADPGPGPTKVNGGWSAWGAWQTCSAGTQYRTRSCTNPAPSGWGDNCVGSTSESQSCTSVDTCLPATCPSGSKYFYQNSQDFMKVCQMSGANCVSTSVGSTCSHKVKSPYSMCSQTNPGSAGGLSSCTYQGLTYWTSTGCSW